MLAKSLLVYKNKGEEKMKTRSEAESGVDMLASGPYTCE